MILLICDIILADENLFIKIYYIKIYMKQKFKILSLFISVALIGLSVFLYKTKIAEAAYGQGDMVISEFKLSGTQWVELANNTDLDINLASSTWTLESMQAGPAGTFNNNLTTGVVPARGMLVISGVTMTTGDGFQNKLSLKESGNTIFALSYGQAAFGPEPHVNIGPALGQSGILTGTSTPVLSVTTTISKGWFNETINSFDCLNPPMPGAGGLPPSLSAIVACIPGITTNMADTSTIPDPTHATGLYFSTSTGKIDYGSSVLNLTDQNTRDLLETLGTNMKLNGGVIGLDASSSAYMRNPASNITISFYNMGASGYANMNTTSIRVKDDDGNYIPTSSPNFPTLANMNWAPGTNGGTFSFGSNHFSEYDINPTVVEVTPVPTPATNTSPSYTFGTNVTGTAVFGGDCAMASASTVNGNNTVVFGPLGIGTHSNCTVKVVDTLGASTTLAVSSFTINSSLAAPTGITAIGTSTSRIDLNWNTASGANYYHIYRSTDNVTFGSLATTSATNYSNTSLTTNTPYYYTVSSVGGTGESASSSVANTYTYAAVPASLFITSSGTTQFSFSWSSNSNPTSTNYQYIVGPVNNTVVATTTATSPGGNLTPNTQYTVYVAAISGAGITTTQISAVDWTKPRDPTTLVNTASTTNSLSFSWSGTTNPTGTVYQLNGSGFSSVTTTATSTIVTGLTPNASFTFITVKAFGHDYPAAGYYVSGGPAYISAYTKAADPTGLVTTASTTNSISLQWNANNNPGGTVYQISGAGFSTVTTSATSTTIGSLASNTSYSFLVQAQNADGSLTTGVSVSENTKGSAPGTPTGLTASPSSTSVIQLSWTSPGGLFDYFTVYHSTNGSTYSVIATTTSGTVTYNHSALATNTIHYYKVSAVNVNGEGASSSPANTYTFAATPVSLVSTASTSASISLAWGANGNSGGTVYQISGTGFVTVTTTATSTSISGLSPNASYTFNVQSQNGGGIFGSTASVSDWTKPAAPTSLANTASTTNSLTFTWSANDNPDGTYYLLIANNFGPFYISTTTKTVTGLSPAVDYTSVQVYSLTHDYPGSGYLAVDGPILSDVYTKAVDPASLVTTASTSNSISLQWNANGNAGGTVYQISGLGFATVTTTNVTTTIGSLSPNTGYTFTVKTQNHDSSYTAGVSLLSPTKAAAPVSPATTATTSVSLSLAWGDNGNPAGTTYQLYGSGFSTTSVSVTTTVLSGLTPNTSYTVNIRTQNPDNSFTTSVNKTDYTKAAVPGTPSASPTSSTQIILTWAGNSNPGTTIYQILGGPSSPTTTATTLTINGLTSGNSYQFAVRAQDLGDANWTAYSASSTASSPWSLPAVTTVAASSIASTSAALNGNITSIGGTAVTSRGFDIGTTTSYDDNNLESGSFGTGAYALSFSSGVLHPGTIYHYRARAQNSVGLATGTDMMFITTFVPTAGNPTSTITSADTVTSTVAVPSSVTNAIVDLSSLTSSNSTTLPGALQVSADTTLGTVQVSIPAGTKITADDTWNGTLVMPTIKDNSSVTVTADSGMTATVNEVVEIGFGDVALTLDHAARILIPGKAGKDAGYYRDGTFTKITATCGDDTQTTNNGLAPGADCKIDVGGTDLAIWTKHFTSFVVYTQTSQSSGGGGGGGSYVPYTPVTSTLPVVTTTPVITPTPPVSVITPPTTPVSSQAVANNFNSLVSFSNLPLASMQPGTALKFNYSFKNTGSKSLAIRIVRSIKNSKGNAVKTVKANKTLKAGAAFNGVVNEIIAKSTPAGVYTVNVNIYDAKTGKLIDGNNFNITVEKLKKKYFTLGEVSSADSAISFDSAVLAKVKSNVVLPANLKVKYNYVNNTSAKQTILMVRQLINASGKVVSTKSGKWTMKVGETDGTTFTQALAGDLAAGEYTIKISAHDYATKQVLAENSLGFNVQLK